MSKLDSTQQGIAVEHHFIFSLIVGGGGEVEVMRPTTDDERKDVETHLRRQFKPGLLWQVKSTRTLDDRWKAPRINIQFPVRKDALLTDPRYWYCFAYLDVREVDVDDPLFLVPSEQVHKHATREDAGAEWRFYFNASLDPNSKDHWQKFQHSRKDIGPFVLDLMRNQKLSPATDLETTAPLVIRERVLFVRPRE